MQLSNELIEEFIELYKKHYGVVLDREVAIKKGIKLCNLIRLVDFNHNEYENDK